MSYKGGGAEKIVIRLRTQLIDLMSLTGLSLDRLLSSRADLRFTRQENYARKTTMCQEIRLPSGA